MLIVKFLAVLGLSVTVNPGVTNVVKTPLSHQEATSGVLK